MPSGARHLGFSTVPPWLAGWSCARYHTSLSLSCFIHKRVRMILLNLQSCYEKLIFIRNLKSIWHSKEYRHRILNNLNILGRAIQCYLWFIFIILFLIFELLLLRRLMLLFCGGWNDAIVHLVNCGTILHIYADAFFNFCISIPTLILKKKKKSGKTCAM